MSFVMIVPLLASHAQHHYYQLDILVVADRTDLVSPYPASKAVSVKVVTAYRDQIAIVL